MERESLLCVLIVLLAGAALQLFAYWPAIARRRTHARQLERASWTRLWWPLMPALWVAAWLCGWALSEPDPVPDPVGRLVFAACVPFGLIAVRAIARAAWSLLCRSEAQGVATIGLVRPRIVLTPGLARLLDDRALRAALEHERAHVRHHDPLRIWLAQFVTDLQWPWPSARRRFRAWLAALECARDEEARIAGTDGADLAAAVIATLRFHGGLNALPCAELTGERSAIEERVARLLEPLPEPVKETGSWIGRVALALTPALLVAVTLGMTFGERVLEPLLALGS